MKNTLQFLGLLFSIPFYSIGWLLAYIGYIINNMFWLIGKKVN